MDGRSPIALADHESRGLAERMRAVANAAAGVIGARSHDQLRGVLEEACRNAIPFDAFFILAYDESSHSFRGFGGLDSGISSPPNTVSAAGRPGERVVRERRTLVTLRADDPAAQGAELTGTGRRSESTIRTPILLGEKVFGILSVQSYTPDLYTWQDVEALEAIASLAATAIENIRLLNDRSNAERALRGAERHAHGMANRMRAVAAAAAGVIGARTLGALQEVLRQASFQVIPFDAFTFALFDPAASTLHYLEGYDAGVFVPAESISVEGVPSERVIRERRSLVVLSSDDPAGAGTKLMGTGRRSESTIRTPILGGDEVLGVIAVHSYEPGQYSDQDVEVLEAIASLAATAIENIRLSAERSRAEAALRDSEASYRAVFELSSDGIYVHDVETGALLDVNRRAQELQGYSLEEFQQDGLAILDTGIPPYDREHAVDWIMRAAAGEPQRFEWLARKRDGELFWFDVRLQRVVINGQERLLANARDITDRKRAEEALQAANEALELRVVERTHELARANEALREAMGEAEQAREAAESANRAKSEFLSRMSHELRTPMNSILGFGQLLARQGLVSEQRRSVDHILKAGQHLLSLINEVLDLARIEAQRETLSPEPVHIGTALREAINLIRPLAAQAGCTIADDPAVDAAVDDALWVRADRQRLAQVLLNLLSNAVKYNRPGGRVWLTCEVVEGSHVRVGIHDTGRGIPLQYLDQLFTPFARLGAETTSVEGTGLGLALSRRLVEAMNGTLTVDSRPEEGSTFWLVLVRAEASTDAAQTGSDIVDHESAGQPAARILCIEDNEANLALIESILALRPNVTLIPSLQGGLGVDLAQQHQPDLVLLDVNLPDMPGEEVLRRLRGDARTRGIPVIAISADATPANIRRHVEAGARAWVTKPIDVDSFLRSVDEALAVRALSNHG
jgi:PAS domain S-box-containing protein